MYIVHCPFVHQNDLPVSDEFGALYLVAWHFSESRGVAGSKRKTDLRDPCPCARGALDGKRSSIRRSSQRNGLFGSAGDSIGSIGIGVPMIRNGVFVIRPVRNRDIEGNRGDSGIVCGEIESDVISIAAQI